MIDDVGFDALLGDRAFDTDWLHIELYKRGASAVVSPQANRKETIDGGLHMYKWRRLVETLSVK